MSEEVAVLGAGNMGTSLGQVIASNGHHVRLWSIEHDVLEEVRDKRLNTKYLEGIRLHDGIRAVWEIDAAVARATLVIVSVPSQVVRAVAHDIAGLIKPGQIVLNVAKGIEADTHLRMSELLIAELQEESEGYVGSMGGPAIAVEMARGLPLAVIIAVPDDGAQHATQRILQNEHLKVATTDDVRGLELCSTLKNVYAIALGIADGMGFGTNTKAFLATLALGEMSDIVETLGGRRGTAYGLAGAGDLLTTGFSQHSRNRTMGERLGSGDDWQHFLRTNTVEGVGACRALTQLTAGHDLHSPLLGVLHDILFEERPAPEAMRNFLRAFSY
jgi:glycerol-3-phosphate dehydrogenase (NAD(P)+)